MSAQPPPRGPKRPGMPPKAGARPGAGPPPSRPGAGPPPSRPMVVPLMSIPPVTPSPGASGDVSVAVAASGDSGGGTVTARKAGGLRDVALEVDLKAVGVKAALQHLAKAINIAFQTDYGENYLEAVYQAAIVRKGEIMVVHKEYFGFRENWFGSFGMLLRSMQLTLDGPDPVSPEGQRRILEKGPASIRGLLNLCARKLDLVAEYEDRVPAYVEQMFDRLEASGIILGWDRDQWQIETTKIGLNIRIIPVAAAT